MAAGQGLKDSEILGAYLEQSTGIGVGGMVLTTYPVSLFLKDGTVYNDPYWAPASFNDKLSRQLEPQKWGKWTRQGNDFVIRWGDGETQTFEVEGAPKPLPAGTRLSGAFQTISGGGNTALGGDVMVAGGSTYTFRPDGTFSGGTFGSVGSSAVTAGSTRKTGGTYVVSGYGITLKGQGVRSGSCSSRVTTRTCCISAARPTRPTADTGTEVGRTPPLTESPGPASLSGRTDLTSRSRGWLSGCRTPARRRCRSGCPTGSGRPRRPP